MNILVSIDKLELFAKDFYRFLKESRYSFIALVGQLGAGKTTFVRYFTQLLCGESFSQVSSPSFTIIKKYKCFSKTIYHLDLYRIDDFYELEYISILDIFLANEDKIIFIEWFDKFKEDFKDYNIKVLYLNINYTQKDDIREFKMLYEGKGNDIFSNRYI